MEASNRKSHKVRWRRANSVVGHGGITLLVGTAIVVGCSGSPESASQEKTESAGEALAATLSGTILDTSGRPLSGVTVRLNGATQQTQTTGNTGTYAFAVNVAGATASFSIMPTRTGCTFNPSVVNLNAINGSRVNNFTGSGTSCIGVSQTVDAGHDSGSGTVDSGVDAGQSSAIDPGPRGGAPGAGGASTPQPIDPDSEANQSAEGSACISALSNISPAANLSPQMQQACEQAFIRFQEVDSVSGTQISSLTGALENGVGLGPTFNGNSCAMCHAEPAIGGSSPGLSSPQHAVPNPQIALATLDGATNTVPSFITASGPVREARFVHNADGSGDGGVHGLFTIAGRQDAQTCSATQPPFAAEVAANNVIFRIPTPTFGTGLIENVLETALESNLNATPTVAGTGLSTSVNSSIPTSASLGITGVLNRSGNDGTITRFGWKAQNKSLTIFGGEAYNVEQGVSNLAFPNEREGGASNLAGCFNLNATPEDNNNFTPGAATVSDSLADLANFALAMQLSAPPTPAVAPFAIGSTSISAAEVTQGQTDFFTVGCANCHTPTLQTAQSSFDPAMSNVQFHPYSDIAIHHMGATLADGVAQGGASGDQFRSAPLWGVGQRLFFLHDGRTSDLVQAIEAHASTGSEANTVIANFNKLSAADQQDVVDFLRSL